MKVYNPQSHFQIHPQITELVHRYRVMKNFHPQEYVDKKISLLHQYMEKFQLKSCIVAVSGGIDSALVLSLVHLASQKPNSPIEKIIAVSLPVSESTGATGQKEATNRAKELCQALQIEHTIIELEPTHKTIESSVSKSLNIVSENWALGQLVAHTRTPTLYYIATLLTQKKLPAIIIGTTNRDEGLYLGYFGKASDGLVDIQLISDLHKSEVYQLSHLLNVPQSILEVSPQGDMYDGRIDEEVFGASYDFVEYYLHYLSLDSTIQQFILKSLSLEAQKQFSFFQNNLENLHRYNKHKYLNASPAIHLDLDTILIPEGWKTNCLFSQPKEKPIIFDNIVGLFEFKDLPYSFLANRKIQQYHKKINHQQDIFHLQNVLSSEECQWLIAQTKDQNWLPANLYGKQKDFDPISEQEKSHRLSVYNKILAYALWNRISPFIEPYKIFKSPLPIISNQQPFWIAKEINPLFRYIRYQPHHSLIVHYDDTYEYHVYKKTLLTVVFYLDASNAQTRFIIDPQQQISDINKNFQDWDRLAQKEEVYLQFTAKAGDVLIFDHRLLHDATPPENMKHILRTDIVFEAPHFGFEL